MKILFDTSVLESAIVEPHPMHSRAMPWLQRAKAGKFDFVVASHTLAELYAVLTTLPVRPRISPAIAWRLVHENVETSAKIVSLSGGLQLHGQEYGRLGANGRYRLRCSHCQSCSESKGRASSDIQPR